MNLKPFFDSLPDDLAKASFAVACGCSVGHIRNVCNRTRTASESLCVAAERASKGMCTCEEMRPDVTWVRIKDKTWPHRRGRPLVDVAETVGNE
jgi:hypothetical protein